METPTRLWELTADAKEDRTAFIAALIAQRCIAPGSHPLAPRPRFNPYQAQRIAVTLVKLARSVAGFAAADCSYQVSDRQRKTAENKKAKIADIAEMIGLTATTSGDPRGAVVYIADPANPKDGDDMGGRGWGIY